MCFIGLAVSVIAGLIPTLIYGWFVNWLDRHEKEPWWLLALVFVWGAVPALIIALLAQLLLDIPTTWVLVRESQAYEIVGSSLWAPITEEIAKGLGILLVLLIARREIDSVLDGIVYGAMAGLGFAFTENLLYFGVALAEDGWGSWAVIVLLRTVPFGLNHALFTGLIGAGLAAAYLSHKKWIKFMAPVGGLLAGMFFHGIHNLGASLADLSCLTICGSFLFDWGGILMVGVMVVLVWRQERRWINAQLSEEVTNEVFLLMTDGKRWRKALWGACTRADLGEWRRLNRLRQAATELAFKKQQLLAQGPNTAIEKDIQRYREQLSKLGVRPPDS